MESQKSADKVGISLPSEVTVQGEPTDDGVSQARRRALLQVAKKASFVAPATLALLSMEAKASSLTC